LCGARELAYQQGFFTITRLAPRARAPAKSSKSAARIRGQGRVEKERIIELRIPPRDRKPGAAWQPGPDDLRLYVSMLMDILHSSVAARTLGNCLNSISITSDRQVMRARLAASARLAVTRGMRSSMIRSFSTRP